MNCVELQQSLANTEDASTAEQRAHVKGCPACAALVKELNVIVAAAGELREADEPSPRVWNSIEAALRQEGLIRPAPHPLEPSFSGRWGAFGWLVPAMAMLLIALGIYLRREQAPRELAHQPTLATSAAAADLSDDDFLQEIAANTPTMKVQYEENLRRVNESIREAEGLVRESPYDGEARQSLLDAYQQKSMLFEMAMDRPLP